MPGREGRCHRRIAVRLGRPASTVRGWLRAFTGNAAAVRAVFTALLVEPDPEITEYIYRLDDPPIAR